MKSYDEINKEIKDKEKNLPIDKFLDKDREVKAVAGKLLDEIEKEIELQKAKENVTFWYFLFGIIVFITILGVLIVYQVVK